MKNQKGKLSLDEIKVQSFVTSIDEVKAQKILGGAASHPTHTEETDKHETCTCAPDKTQAYQSFQAV